MSNRKKEYGVGGHLIPPYEERQKVVITELKIETTIKKVIWKDFIPSYIIDHSDYTRGFQHDELEWA